MAVKIHFAVLLLEVILYVVNSDAYYVRRLGWRRAQDLPEYGAMELRESKVKIDHGHSHFAADDRQTRKGSRAGWKNNNFRSSGKPTGKGCCGGGNYVEVEVWPPNKKYTTPRPGPCCGFETTTEDWRTTERTRKTRPTTTKRSRTTTTRPGPTTSPRTSRTTTWPGSSPDTVQTDRNTASTRPPTRPPSTISTARTTPPWSRTTTKGTIPTKPGTPPTNPPGQGSSTGRTDRPTTTRPGNRTVTAEVTTTTPRWPWSKTTTVGVTTPKWPGINTTTTRVTMTTPRWPDIFTLPPCFRITTGWPGIVTPSPCRTGPTTRKTTEWQITTPVTPKPPGGCTSCSPCAQWGICNG